MAGKGTILIFVPQKQTKYICFEGSRKTNGEMAEWLNAAVLKTVKDASPSGVRIPISPQKNIKPQISFKYETLRFFC